MPHSVNADTVMENENYNVDVRNARLGRADPSGEFELSPNLVRLVQIVCVDFYYPLRQFILVEG